MQFDPIFAPLKLNCDDSKAIFHPLDFIVFHGMKNRDKPYKVTEIVLLDKAGKTGEALEVQKSIENVMRKKKFEWIRCAWSRMERSKSNDGVYF